MKRLPESDWILYNIENSASGGALPKRSEIAKQYKWNLEDIYAGADAWEKDFHWVEENLDRYDAFEGKLGQNAEMLLACLSFDEEIGAKTERLHLYSMLAKDVDLADSEYQKMYDRMKNLYARAKTASAFIRPEIIAIDESKLSEFRQNPQLKRYDHFFDVILRAKGHTLPKEQENLLAMASESLQIPYDAFSMLSNADMKFPVIKDPNGKEIEMSHGRYYAALYSTDRDYRERSFRAYYKPFIENVNTLATLFNGGLKANAFEAKARKYNSAREAALDANNIPLTVYDKLVGTVNEELAPMHRWAELKRKLLKVDKLHPYDAYVTLFPAKQERKYPYDEAIEIVNDSLRIMGDEYLDALNTAFRKRWIDVYETTGKRSGAYSSGTTFGVHPYVLLNWTDLLNDVFILAHEMGHNMHSWFTGQHQPYIYSDYTIFVAEVASTFNESLLLEYLIEKAESREQKLSLMERYLNNVTATFYRQTMFAEFEMKSYDFVEKGAPLTHRELCDIYGEHASRYWGDAMEIDTEETYTWARVPHFYYNYYVYQYATGMAASEALVKQVKEGGKEALDAYLTFLKSGSSDYSINLLKQAGVDMMSDEPVKAVAQKMNRVLDEMEKLLAEG